MNIRSIIITAVLLTMALTGCHSDYCTVKGTIKGVKDGTELELEDAWNQYKVVEKTKVENGSFEFHPQVSAPTHVYLYSTDGQQLKDFILEPGTILVDVDDDDEMDCFTGATGTISNDTRRKYRELNNAGDKGAAEAIMDQVLNAEQTGPLALYFAGTAIKPSFYTLKVLERLSPELSGTTYATALKDELTRRVRTEPRAEGSDIVPIFIDMEYPDAEGETVSLSSVVNNPVNRFVIVDFWATWCVPCVAAIPQLREVYAKYHPKGVEIYSVSEDSSVETWKAFLAPNGMNWINVLDNAPGRKDSKAWNDYALNGIPTVIVIDCQSREIIARGNHLDLDSILASFLQ